MANVVKHEDVVSGMWKFGPEVPVQELLDLAIEWSETDQFYLDLHVRKCSDVQHGIGFAYIMKDGMDEKKFHYKMTDILKRRFGNDFVGWDISSPTWIIK